MNLTYNNPGLVQKYNDVNSEAEELRSENTLLRSILKIVLSFNLVIGIAAVTGLVIFFISR